MQVNWVNESKALTDDEVKIIMAAAQIQISRDLESGWGWGKDVRLNFTTYDKADPSEMLGVFLDNSDQAGALGYHEVTSNNAPMFKVFVADDLRFGYLPSVTATHEQLETLVDPLANWKYSDQSFTKDYMVEVCDACEDDQFAYDINGIKVSDFVLPPWFELPPRTVPVKYDFCGYISTPYQILTGGYAGYYDLVKRAWVQDTYGAHRQSQEEYNSKSRFRLLQKPRKDWVQSTRV